MSVYEGFKPEASSPTTSRFPWCCAPFPFLRRKSDTQCEFYFASKEQATNRQEVSWLKVTSVNEKHAIGVIDEQPDSQMRPVLRPAATADLASDLYKSPRKSFGSNRMSFSNRKRFRSDASSCRPLISAPSEFRHLSSGSFPTSLPNHSWAQPVQPATPSTTTFQPLQLSMDTLSHHMSPILPSFEFPRAAPSPPSAPSPPPAYVSDDSDRGHQLLRQRSYSSLSFHIPRKRTLDSVTSAALREIPATNTPPIPPRSRARTHSSTDVDHIRERVASAMIEMEMLQKEIDDVIERQSLYESSRPSTAHSMTRTVHGKLAHRTLFEDKDYANSRLLELEPMPSIPALPPSAPSFAERLNVDGDRDSRPHTAPIKASSTKHAAKRTGLAPAVKRTSASSQTQNVPPPPLPLVLRPPLRKKKSFSRVSTWLFPDPSHRRDMSVDSVTNVPRPVTNRDGFYQCVEDGEVVGNFSYGSLNSLSTFRSDEDDEEVTRPNQRITTPTRMSLEATPVIRQDGPAMESCWTFGKNSTELGMTTVGMAM